MRKIILRTEAESRNVKHAANVFFKCVECKKTKQVNQDGCSTGYGIDSTGNLVCFDCCGKRDKRDMIATGKAYLYLTTNADNGHKHHVSNWPGTLKMNVPHVKRGHHNIARNRYDFWFTGPDDCEWHGVVIGDNTQVARCRRLKHSTTHKANAQFARA